MFETVRNCLQPMRHRKVKVEVSPPLRPLVCSLLGKCASVMHSLLGKCSSVIHSLLGKCISDSFFVG